MGTVDVTVAWVPPPNSLLLGMKSLLNSGNDQLYFFQTFTPIISRTPCRSAMT